MSAGKLEEQQQPDNKRPDNNTQCTLYINKLIRDQTGQLSQDLRDNHTDYRTICLATINWPRVISAMKSKTAVQIKTAPP